LVVAFTELETRGSSLIIDAILIEDCRVSGPAVRHTASNIPLGVRFDELEVSFPSIQLGSVVKRKTSQVEMKQCDTNPNDLCSKSRTKNSYLRISQAVRTSYSNPWGMK
jgi:hypothetical protein